MSEVDAIRAHHEGDHLAQPCSAADFPCDVQTLLAVIDDLTAQLAKAKAPEPWWRAEWAGSETRSETS